MRRQARAGFTLVELVVVVAIVAITASIGGVAFLRVRDAREAPSMAALMQAARREALRRGVAVAVVDSAPGRAPRRAMALPDGRVVADSGFGVEMLTGVADSASAASRTRAVAR
jgi:prepilin-type N-terminal cleavage/methylation domain-containing protein